MELAIVDYGMGNLLSVANAFHHIGVEAEVVSNPNALGRAKRIVLPGVGAFGDGMRNLRDAGLIEALREQVLDRKKPFLGICLGMEMLATLSYEHGEFQGLDWIAGNVVRLELSRNVRVPHIGWNGITIKSRDPLLKGCKDSTAFYFVHGYHFVPESQDSVTSTCYYGGQIVATVRRDNIFGAQFHPEKSHNDGLNLLKNFCQYSSTDYA